MSKASLLSQPVRHSREDVMGPHRNPALDSHLHSQDAVEP